MIIFQQDYDKVKQAEVYAKRVLGARHATRTEAGRLAVMVLELVRLIQDEIKDVV